MIRAKRDARTGRACEWASPETAKPFIFWGSRRGSIETKRNARSRSQGGAKRAKTSEPRQVVRAADLPPPDRVSDDDFDVICLTFAVERGKRDYLRHYLDEIVDELAAKIQGKRLRPDRQADRDRLRRIHETIQKARRELEAPMGDVAEFALQCGVPLVELMVHEYWFRGRLSGVIPTEEEIFKDPDEVRREMRPLLHEFARDRSAEFLSAVLEEIEAALMTARTFLGWVPGARGGRQPLTQRRDLIVKLAICWDNLGKAPTSGPNSQFTAFCEAVFDAIGWPPTGVEAAVPDALGFWRNPPKKRDGPPLPTR